MYVINFFFSKILEVENASEIEGLSQDSSSAPTNNELGFPKNLFRNSQNTSNTNNEAVKFKQQKQIKEQIIFPEIEYDKIDREWIGTPFHIIGISKFRG